ncbi:hypothetical protein N1851_014339 [Merluccius polli]|uniref:Uncharacterized protein n=1 Tax=Merluccius polli TaxID=89951 RepID=A0AA47P2U4_MERPO|nr:hypothetical protein N1851_014339 [Merluccius polli]
MLSRVQVNSEQVGLESLVIDSAVLASAGRLFHHSGAKTEKSCDLAVRPLLALRDGGTGRSDEVVAQRALAGAWGLTSGSKWREERGHVGELRQVEHESCCRVLDALQRLDRGGRESSQERVAVVEAGDDESARRIMKPRESPSRGRGPAGPGSSRSSASLCIRRLIEPLSGPSDRRVSIRALVSCAGQLTRTKRREHISPVLAALPWLPVTFIIHFKFLLLIHKALNGLGPSYNANSLVNHLPSRTYVHLLLVQLPSNSGRKIREAAFIS